MKQASVITLMLLGGARRVSLAEKLKESGRKLGYRVEIISYDLSLEVPVALEAIVVKGLKWDDPEVIDDIEKTVDKYQVDIILPIVNGAVEIASKCRHRLKDVFIPVSDAELTTKLFDKSEAAQIFKESGFPIPKKYSVLSAQMPAIAKPRKGGSSRGIKIFHDIEDLMHLQNLQDYLVQEYIENGTEYTVDAYIDKNGETLVKVPRRRLEIMGGESTRSLTCRNAILESLTDEVISTLKLRGPVNLQFIYDPKDDRYLLMEVNPRIGGGAICSMLAGAPITDYILLEALDKPVEKCTDWRAGTLMARYFKEAVFNLESQD